MILGIITLLTALSISGVAAYISILGLAALFSGSFLSVIIMGSCIEVGKLVTAVWLKVNWADELVSKLHKSYLIFALIMCMLITSLGIFGFLSKAHLDQAAPIQKDIIQIDVTKDKLALKKSQLEQAYKQLDQLNRQINKTFWGKSKLVKERRILQDNINKINNDLNKLVDDVTENKQNIKKVDIKLGPIKYFADIMFDDPEENIDKAIQILIVMIMFVFDPLAIVLLLSAVISFQQSNRKKELKKINNTVKKEPAKEIQVQVQVQEKVVINNEDDVFYDTDQTNRKN